MALNLRIKLLGEFTPPSKGSFDCAALDLFTPYAFKAFANVAPMDMTNGEPGVPFPDGLLPMGIASSFDPAYVGLVLPRSGLGSKEGLIPRNIVGVIDADYRGEWKIAFRVDNAQLSAYHAKGEPVLQVLFVPIADVSSYTLEDMDGNEQIFNALHRAVKRGEDGFGSTSVNTKQMVEEPAQPAPEEPAAE